MRAKLYCDEHVMKNNSYCNNKTSVAISYPAHICYAQFSALVSSCGAISPSVYFFIILFLYSFSHLLEIPFSSSEWKERRKPPAQTMFKSVCIYIYKTLFYWIKQNKITTTLLYFKTLQQHEQKLASNSKRHAHNKCPHKHESNSYFH